MDEGALVSSPDQANVGHEIKSVSGLSLSRVRELQEDYFKSRRTLEYGFRMEQLRRFYESVNKFESKILHALEKDLGKGRREGLMMELGMVRHEITYFRSHLKSLMKRRGMPTPFFLMPARSFRQPEPLGRVLILGPWNYPFNLTLLPLIGAIAAGNCAVVKPSELSPHCSEVMAELIAETFPEEYITTFLGGVEVGQNIVDQPWDHVFFTGSTRVGSEIAQIAAKHLTPTTLELGGKSPGIISANAHVRIAARRLAFGKLTNAGQSCIAPDYLLVDESVKDSFLSHLKSELQAGMGTPKEGDYTMGRIVSEKHYSRLENLRANCSVIWEGPHDRDSRYMAPVILEPEEDHKIWDEEIFGPLLPIQFYKKFEDALEIVNRRPKPLAAYLFTEDSSEINTFMDQVSFGGGCINDTVFHLANNRIPFGGVGPSGIGSYHGEFSFHTFSHYKSIVQAATFLDLPTRYLPFSFWKEKLLRFFLR